MAIYEKVVRPLLFRCDAEWIHDRAIGWIQRPELRDGDFVDDEA